MKKLLISVICIGLVFVLGACASAAAAGLDLTQGGNLHLSEEMEFAIVIDQQGNVETVTACRDDGNKVLAEYTGFQGKDCETVTQELVEAIREAGFYVEEVEQEPFGITIELERGIRLPGEKKINEAARKAQERIQENGQTIPTADKYRDHVCTNPSCNDWDCDDWDCDDGICTNPNCTERDCDDKYCDAGACTNPRCDEQDCDDWDCDEGWGD